MAFTSGIKPEIQSVGAGESWDADHLILPFEKFVDTIKAGLFSRDDAGTLSKVDGTATPVLAGVTLRRVSSAVEHAGEYKTAFDDLVNVQRKGLVTVTAVTGQNPAKFASIYAENSTSADYGKATLTSAGNVDANAEFIRKITDTVWLINLKG